MTADSMKQSINNFKLAVTVVLSFGLGMARVLPVQAAAIAKPLNPSQSYSQTLESYQLKLDDLTLPSTVKTQTRAAQTALAPFSWDAEAPAPQVAQATQADRDDTEAGQGARFSEGLFSVVFFATLAYMIYNLISRGRSVATVSPPSPTTTRPASTGPASTGPVSTGPVSTGPVSTGPAAPNAATETSAPPTWGETPSNAPVAVPSPALLPGLLGLSLKLLRQKKAEPQMTGL
ncbi:MAG: PTPA-CTERM sorting domain-containing protein [Leptolyngbya sp. DLM2.Bin27]|nr:MAG: PTPA-CTERM sorting domain-containing protein [Leptolyngbya sp. DLM2.Bin27]